MNMIVSGGMQTVRKLQYVYLDFDGEYTSYRGELLTVEQIEVTHSKLDNVQINQIIDVLNAQYAERGVVFVSERPADLEFSTIYVGATDSFAEYGSFAGLAETIDHDNLIANDNAFVILNGHEEVETIAEIIAHETDHLIGALDHGGEGLNAYAANYSGITVEKPTVLTLNTGNLLEDSKVIGGGKVILNGGSASGTVLSGLDNAASNMGQLTVNSGGRADATTINSRGWLLISNGGSASGVEFNDQGRLWISSGGYAEDIKVQGRNAEMFVYANGLVSGVTINRGNIYVGNSASGVITSGGTVYDIDMFGHPTSGSIAGVYVAGGGLISGGTVNGSGATVWMGVFEGGKVSGITVQGDGAQMAVSLGGQAYDTIIKSGGSVFASDGGIAYRTSVFSGGTLDIKGSGTIDDAVIHNGATLYVRNYGEIRNVSIENGAIVAIYGGATLKGVTTLAGKLTTNREGLGTQVKVDNIVFKELNTGDVEVENVTGIELIIGTTLIQEAGVEFAVSLDIKDNGKFTLKNDGTCNLDGSIRTAPGTAGALEIINTGKMTLLTSAIGTPDGKYSSIVHNSTEDITIINSVGADFTADSIRNEFSGNVTINNAGRMRFNGRKVDVAGYTALNVALLNKGNGHVTIANTDRMTLSGAVISTNIGGIIFNNGGRFVIGDQTDFSTPAVYNSGAGNIEFSGYFQKDHPAVYGKYIINGAVINDAAQGNINIGGVTYKLDDDGKVVVTSENYTESNIFGNIVNNGKDLLIGLADGSRIFGETISNKNGNGHVIIDGKGDVAIYLRKPDNPNDSGIEGSNVSIFGVRLYSVIYGNPEGTENITITVGRNGAVGGIVGSKDTLPGTISIDVTNVEVYGEIIAGAIGEGHRVGGAISLNAEDARLGMGDKGDDYDFPPGNIYLGNYNTLDSAASATMTVTDSTIGGSIFGGGKNSTVAGNIAITLTNVAMAPNRDLRLAGAGADVTVGGKVDLLLTGGSVINADIYGAWDNSKVAGDVDLRIDTGVAVNGNVVMVSNSANVGGNAVLTMKGGTISGDVTGGVTASGDTVLKFDNKTEKVHIGGEVTGFEQIQFAGQLVTFGSAQNLSNISISIDCVLPNTLGGIYLVSRIDGGAEDRFDFTGTTFTLNTKPADRFGYYVFNDKYYQVQSDDTRLYVEWVIPKFIVTINGEDDPASDENSLREGFEFHDSAYMDPRNDGQITVGFLPKTDVTSGGYIVPKGDDLQQVHSNLFLSGNGVANTIIDPTQGGVQIVVGGATDNQILRIESLTILGGGDGGLVISSGGTNIVGNDGLIASAIISGGGSQIVSSGGTVNDTTVLSRGGFTVLSSGTVKDIIVSSGGSATFGDDSIVTGDIKAGGEVTVGEDVDGSAANLWFIIDDRTPRDSYIYRNLDGFTEVNAYYISVTADQEPGEYKLADGARNFNDEVIFTVGGEPTGDRLTMDNDVIYNKLKYDLQRNDKGELTVKVVVDEVRQTYIDNNNYNALANVTIAADTVSLWDYQYSLREALQTYIDLYINAVQTVTFDEELNGQDIAITNGSLIITRNVSLKGNGVDNTDITGSLNGSQTENNALVIRSGVMFGIEDITISAPILIMGGGTVLNTGTSVLNNVQTHAAPVEAGAQIVIDNQGDHLTLNGIPDGDHIVALRNTSEAELIIKNTSGIFTINGAIETTEGVNSNIEILNIGKMTISSGALFSIANFGSGDISIQNNGIFEAVSVRNEGVGKITLNNDASLSELTLYGRILTLDGIVSRTVAVYSYGASAINDVELINSGTMTLGGAVQIGVGAAAAINIQNAGVMSIKSWSADSQNRASIVNFGHGTMQISNSGTLTTFGIRNSGNGDLVLSNSGTMNIEGRMLSAADLAEYDVFNWTNAGFTQEDMEALLPVLKRYCDGRKMAMEGIGLNINASITVNNDSNGKMIIDGMVMGVIGGGIQFSNEGTLSVGVASDPNAIALINVYGNMNLLGNGSYTINGSIVNLGDSDIHIKLGKGSHINAAKIENVGAGALIITMNGDIESDVTVTGEVIGEYIKISGIGTVLNTIKGEGAGGNTSITVSDHVKVGNLIGVSTQITGNSTITISNQVVVAGTIIGGGSAVNVGGGVTINVSESTLQNTVIGGGANGSVSGNITMTIASSTATANIIGGGQDGNVIGNVTLNVTNASVEKYIFGGSVNSSVGGLTTLNLNNGIVNNVVGGGAANGSGNTAESQNILLKIGAITMQKSNSSLFGGGYASGGGKVTAGTITITANSADAMCYYLYGGGWATGANSTSTTGAVTMSITDGVAKSYVYCAGRAEKGATSTVASVEMNISGGSFASNVIGGGYAADGSKSTVSGNVNITITGGSFAASIFGGGQIEQGGAKTGVANVNGNISITLDCSGANEIHLADTASIFLAGAGTTLNGGGTVQSTSTLTMTLKGESANLSGGSYSGTINGAGGSNGGTAATRLLVFDNFSGDLNAKLASFTEVHLLGNSAVNMTNSFALVNGTDYTFALQGRDADLSATAMYSMSSSLGINADSNFTVTISWDEIFAQYELTSSGAGSFELLSGRFATNWNESKFGADCFELSYFDSYGADSTDWGGVGASKGLTFNDDAVGEINFWLSYGSGVGANINTLSLNWEIADLGVRSMAMSDSLGNNINGGNDPWKNGNLA